MSAFLMYTMMVTAPIAAVAGVLTRFSEALGAFGRVAQVLEQPQERQVEVISARGSRAGRKDLAFEFDDVFFVHEGADRPSISGLTLAIPARQFTAIVGPSGAGKSTLFHLLERFYDATSGSLRFFGDDVRRIERDAVRRRVAYVEQGGPVVPGTVGDNLRIGMPDLADEDCVQALLAVNLATSRREAQQRLAQQAGEGGSLMSGGERQRLAIARALLRRSDVILLDEATSNLDSANEHIVQDALAAAGRDRTLVVIAHRLSTVVAADSIAVMDGGQLVAFGPHEDLLDSCSLYRDLAAGQLLHAGR
jgi:ABC-type multidrug transport system fused ATPase/permease subunit